MFLCSDVAVSSEWCTDVHTLCTYTYDLTTHMFTCCHAYDILSVLLITCAIVQVRYLKIIEKSGYQALPWVRYITQNGGMHSHPCTCVTYVV